MTFDPEHRITAASTKKALMNLGQSSNRKAQADHILAEFLRVRGLGDIVDAWEGIR